MRSRSELRLSPVLLTAALFLSGCAVGEEGAGLFSAPEAVVTGAGDDDPLREARAANRFRYVDPDFPATPVVLEDSDGRGSAELFFGASQTAVVSGPSDAAQLRAASIAVANHAPMLVYTRETHPEIVAELEKLGASHILLVGDVQLAATSGNREVIRDPGTLDALGQLTARRFTEQTVDDPADMVPALAVLDPGESTLLVPTWDELPAEQTAGERLPAFPAQSRRDARAAPVVIATAASPLVAVANARSYGADVTVLDDPDPAVSLESMNRVAGLADRPLIALGGQFGTAGQLAERIRAGEERFG